MKRASRGLWLAASCLTFTLVSCSDSVPPAARASLNLSLVKTTKNCYFNARSVPRNGPIPSKTDFGTLVTDGESNSTIRCKVAGSGPFSVTGSIEYEDLRFEVNEGAIPGAAQPGTGTIYVYTSSNYGLKGPCTITPITIAPGKVHAEFLCEELAEEQATSACRASGFFAFDRCEK